MFLSVLECSRMSQNVPECPRMSQNVPECPRMSQNVLKCPRIIDVIYGMATMAMAIPTISFGHRSGHFWPQIRPQMAKISQIYAQLVIWPYLQYPYYYGPVFWQLLRYFCGRNILLVMFYLFVSKVNFVIEKVISFCFFSILSLILHN